jgi:cytochrome c-type biogenesis protein CcmH/NrfG
MIMPANNDHNPRPHEGTNANNTQHNHRPYWKRAHRDWRMWVFVILMLVCMGIYLMTGDLRWRVNGPPHQMVPIAG